MQRKGEAVKRSIMRRRWCLCALVSVGLAGSGSLGASALAQSASSSRAQGLGSIRARSLTVTVDADGSYSIAKAGSAGAVLNSRVEATVDGEVLPSSSYPEHKTMQAEFHDELGSGVELTITHSGLTGKPDLMCNIRLYSDQAWGDVAVNVLNTTNKAISVQEIRSVEVDGAPFIDLSGPAGADRVISDSYSEDRPQLAIRDLGDAPKGTLRAVGSQLIYNRKSGESLFLGAVTTDRFLTIMHLKEQGTGADAKILSFDAESTGTTEIMKGESLRDSPPEEQVGLSLPVAAGARLASERLMFAVGTDYHAQLEQYGHVIKMLHQARVETPTPIGWWSWTAYYFGLNQGEAITNAEWLADNLRSSGYKYFQIDEGYQYARGEYTTPDANLFPRGLEYVADAVRHEGLTFGFWTAPFEVSDRAWVYQKHKDWLLHNAAGQLIHIGYVTDHNDPLYVLDSTNPGAQEYLSRTYRTFHDWGVRFIKMDFMDDTSVEGAYYRPHTTALEAQRIGLQIIRNAVGDDTVLDKDGSTMLNPVGYVDAGRISQDTGHTFSASRDAASGIAARYYMNRNFFVADPDAFTVSKQTVDDQSWHGGKRPLSLDEAEVSIALAAVSGGMFEEGDDLPALAASPDRLALVKNRELIDMARLGHSSIPIDLMTYAASDLQPSMFLLKEDKRQSILTIFNWSEKEQKRRIRFPDIGLKDPSKYQITEVFGDQSCCRASGSAISFTQPEHSVRMFKLIEAGIPVTPPMFEIQAATNAKAGDAVTFDASNTSGEEPVLTCHWDFGDGSSLDGLRVQHTYTESGEYKVRATVTGLEGATDAKTVRVRISGSVATKFVPADKKRPE
jgi:alpha-galactosidase